MAAFVVSVEKISTTFGTTSGATSNTVNLSKGQDETQCVPMCTAYTTAAGTDLRENDWFGCEMIDNAGTAAVRVHRNASVTVSQKHVDIFVVEFGSNVTVKQGTASLTGTTASATLSPTIVLANSFCILSQVRSSGTSDDLNDTFVQARFGSTSSVNFDRRASGGPDWTIYWYVVESDGTDFLTEYITASWTTSQTGPTNHTLSNTVTLANAFISSTYETSEGGDDMRDAMVNFALTGTTTLTWYRDNGSTPSATGTFGVWVVRSSEFGVERFVRELNGSTTNDVSITTIDQAQSIVLTSCHVGGGAWGTDGNTTGSNIEDRQNSLVFLTDSSVRLQQQQAESSEHRFEVIEFELEGAAPTGKLSGSLASMGVGF